MEGPRARHVLSVNDYAPRIGALLARAERLKRGRGGRGAPQSLAGRHLALLFDKPSTRTRVSFEVGILELGGRPIYLSSRDLQLGRGETIADTARVLSRYVDGIVYRANRHAEMLELARWSQVPIINALDDLEHPCQALSDLLTLHERWEGRWRGRRLAYIGDGNNVLNSLLLALAAVGADLTAATPPAYRPDAGILSQALATAERTGATIRLVDDPAEAARGADALYTDVWVSMGEEEERAAREAAFRGYRIDEALLGLARPTAFVLHDLPAHRGQEITDAVMDGPRAAVWEQAENRLHAQKALLEWVFERPVSSSRSPTPRRGAGSRGAARSAGRARPAAESSRPRS